jgi:hypothetical protein
VLNSAELSACNDAAPTRRTPLRDELSLADISLMAASIVKSAVQITPYFIAESIHFFKLGGQAFCALRR